MHLLHAQGPLTHSSLPNERSHVFIVAHCEEEVPLLELVDEVDPEGVGGKADGFSEGEQNVETPSSMCMHQAKGQGPHKINVT